MTKTGIEKESLRPPHIESSLGKETNVETAAPTLRQDELDAGVRHISCACAPDVANYAVHSKLFRTAINLEIQLDPGVYELLKEVSYRDGMDDPSKLSKWQLESFVEKAVSERIDKCLKDYANLGEIHSRRIQRKHKHLVTLKEIPNPDSYQGLGTKLVPLDYEEKKREYLGFS